MVAFLDAASTRMFSEALCVLFLKLCSLVMPPLLQGTAERTLPCSLCLKSSVCEFSKWEKIMELLLVPVLARVKLRLMSPGLVVGVQTGS